MCVREVECENERDNACVREGESVRMREIIHVCERGRECENERDNACV
jgi:hypothetical protein